MSPINIACFDIETTGFNTSYNRLLCACFKFQGKAKVVSVLSPRKRDEARAIREIREIWEDIDIAVSWYGKQFDVRFLEAKALRYGIPSFKDKKHVDLCFIHKYRNGTSGHSLRRVAEDLELDLGKFEVPAERWQEAGDGDTTALELIHKHCRVDVRLTEKVLFRMKHQIISITR